MFLVNQSRMCNQIFKWNATFVILVLEINVVHHDKADRSWHFIPFNTLICFYKLWMSNFLNEILNVVRKCNITIKADISILINVCLMRKLRRIIK